MSKPTDFADRVGTPKGRAAKPAPAVAASKPKPVTAADATTKATQGGRGARNGRNRGGKRAGASAGEPRPKRVTKTAEQLDADMDGYFAGPAPEANNENAAPASKPEVFVDHDEALVSS